MSKMLQFIIGGFLILLTPVWVYLISPELLRLPSNYSEKANMVHTENNRFDIGSSWIGKSIAISSSSLQTTFSDHAKSEFSSQFKVESLIGESLFELNQKFTVDRTTRHNLPGGNDVHGDAYIIFDDSLSKDKIDFWPIEMGAPTELSFVDTKIIKNVKTYHFHAINSIIDDTTGYDFLPLVPEKYNVHSFVNIDVYVDPITGTLIDYQDSGTSSYVDGNNKVVWDISQWSNKYNEPTIADRVKEAQQKNQYYIAITIIAPVILGLLGLLLVIMGIFKKNGKH
jgi:hypothetical protein